MFRCLLKSTFPAIQYVNPYNTYWRSGEAEPLSPQYICFVVCLPELS